MPVGTPVFAARGGVVAAVRDDCSMGGVDPKLLDECNLITIIHGDGTLANYLHLRKGGVLVRLGKHVRSGDLIGFSGNTGYTSEPHLHFEVSCLTDGVSPNVP
jgi:murein DD-endopeptidase MepM/ murein hydrolase activator NlpD